MKAAESDLTIRTVPYWPAQRVLLMRVLWIAVAALAIGLFFKALPVHYNQMLTVCMAGDCAAHQLTEQEVHAIAAEGLAIEQYAGYVIALNLVSTVVWWGVAFLVFLRKADEFMAYLVALALVTLGSGYGGMLDVLMSTSPFVQLALQGLAVLAFAASIIFLYTFPDGRFVPHWTRWLALVWMANTTLTMLVAPYLPDSWYGPLGIAGFVLFLIPAVGSVLTQIYRYRQVSTATQRRQTRWVCWGLGAGFGGFIVLSLLQAVIPGLRQPGVVASLLLEGVKTVLLLAIPLSLAVAVLRHRLWDVDPIINRTLVYAALTTIVVAGYVLLVGALSALFQAGSNLLFSLIATGVVAVLFQPLRERLQRTVNRLMYGERDDPYGVISRLGRRLESVLVPDAVLPSIIETVKEALKLPYVAIEWQDDDREQRTDVREHLALRSSAGAGEGQTGPLLRLPLTYQHETLGYLALAPRNPEEPFSPADIRLLEDLARQAGIAVYSVRLTAELQAARERLVTAREEERRRLRRDLHDGLGPSLAAQTLKVGSARTLLTRDPETAGYLLEQLEGDIEVALSNVRRLVYNLRPPALDDLGLIGAIQAYAYQLESHKLRVLVEVSELPPALTAAAEVAIYRIVQEALNNVLRHAQAQRCTVSIVADAVSLRLVIADDGCGLPAEMRTGVGLQSMRERAEELGGSFTVDSVAARGTTVRALLPLADRSSSARATLGYQSEA